MSLASLALGIRKRPSRCGSSTTTSPHEEPAERTRLRNGHMPWSDWGQEASKATLDSPRRFGLGFSLSFLQLACYYLTNPPHVYCQI